MDLHQRYYDGDFEIPTALANVRAAYLDLLREAESNWCQLVVDTTEERLQVEGFRFGAMLEGDQDVWDRIWQPNDLDSDQTLVHQDALITKRSYVLVWFDAKSGVSVTPEPSSDTICAYGRSREPIAALKRWTDEITGERLFAVYTARLITRWRMKATSGDVRTATLDDKDPSNPAEIPNPLGVVPIIEFRNKPRKRTDGTSELAGVRRIQDRINRTLFNRLLAAEFAAFPQKWAVGLEIEYDATGAPIAPYNVAVDRMLVAEDKDVKFGQFTESNLENYIRAASADIEHMAAIAHTPPHYLLGRMANVSGDALKAAEAGLIAKVRRRSTTFGSSWERVIRLSLQVLNDPRASDTSCQVLWTDPEYRTEGELVDALTKMAGLGVPRTELWRRWGISPQDIARWDSAPVDPAPAGDPAAPPVTGP
jgi:hypothetical protein